MLSLRIRRVVRSAAGRLPLEVDLNRVVAVVHVQSQEQLGDLGQLGISNS